ncbi:MAG: hypothetical protein EXR79_07390 [Myxococcales bacterium]|nr:hypothetical protein [Myxococcales bacterium]
MNDTLPGKVNDTLPGNVTPPGKVCDPLDWYDVAGRSMWPLAAPLRVGLERVGVAALCPGDVVAFVGTRTGAVFVHRVRAIDGNRIRTRGDTNLAADPELPASAIIGRVAAIEWRGGRVPVPGMGVVAAIARRTGLAWATVAPRPVAIVRAAWRVLRAAAGGSSGKS